MIQLKYSVIAYIFLNELIFSLQTIHIMVIQIIKVPCDLVFKVELCEWKYKCLNLPKYAYVLSKERTRRDATLD